MSRSRSPGSSRSRPPLGPRGGASLVELLVAILLMAVGVSTLMGAMLTVPVAGRKSQENRAAAEAMANLANELRNYVAADPIPDSGCASAPAPGCPPGDPSGSWHLPGDTTAGWALGLGTHTATGFLPADLQAAPYSGTMTYFVTCAGSAPSCDCTTSPCSVAISARWTTPR